MESICGGGRFANRRTPRRIRVTLKGDTVKDKRTTITGIMLFVGLLIAALAFVFDGDPATNPDWASLTDAMKAIGIGVGATGGLLNGVFSKDK